MAPSQATAARNVSRSETWFHTPSNFAIIWLCISLPLVIWDFSYVFLRPHSMEGGMLHWPLWVPYALYAKVDYVYGWPSYEERDGFNGAQSSMNVMETIAYSVYLWILYTKGRQEAVQGTGAPASKYMGWLSQSRTVHGKWAAYAVLILYGTSLATVSKTVLYWLNEAFSGFSSVGHNDLYSLVVLWVLPNGAWIVVPAYMMYVSGKEILQGLEVATGNSKKHQ